MQYAKHRLMIEAAHAGLERSDASVQLSLEALKQTKLNWQSSPD